eukprot:TRINITY_DN23626_c0_g1_i2.p1 TRINITY_DN23626_c0_g1~~TRINITY_DN23626_c0_g1_i2.p1  ORF type:complete len:245 (+),score=62.74 TRINITY_DN23626_c0_g1_i2:85-819(+)
MLLGLRAAGGAALVFALAILARSTASADGGADADTEDWGDAYWLQELARRPAFEWYGVPWARVRRLLPSSSATSVTGSVVAPLRVLHAGCGTSSWPEDMAIDNLDVVHLDHSAALVEELRRRHPGLRFEVADARALPFAAGSFDVVVEKGLLDALLFSGLSAATAAVEELNRVLRPGGTLISLTSLGGPGEQGPVLGATSWAQQDFVDLGIVDDTSEAQATEAYAGAYVCTKRGSQEEASASDL